MKCSVIKDIIVETDRYSSLEFKIKIQVWLLVQDIQRFGCTEAIEDIYFPQVTTFNQASDLLANISRGLRIRTNFIFISLDNLAVKSSKKIFTLIQIIQNIVHSSIVPELILTWAKLFVLLVVLGAMIH